MLFDSIFLKVRCHGAGLQSHGVLKNKKNEFTVDTKGAGDGDLKIWGLDRDYDPMNIQVKIFDEWNLFLPNYFCFYPSK